MRSDMKYLLGDKRGSRWKGPRKGKRFSKAEFRKYDWDEDDTNFVAGHVGQVLERKLIGTRRWRRGYNHKPLLRYLSSQVGRAWGEVYSDICAALRSSQIAQAHWPYVFKSAVAVDTRLVNGQILVENWSNKLALLSDTHTQFYVDPRDGCLRRNTEIETYRMRQKRLAAEQAAELAPRMRALSRTRQLHLLDDGNWWEVTLAEIGWAKVHGITDDVVLRAGLSYLPRNQLYGREGVIAIAKRPLSRRDLKRHRLR